MRPTGKRRPYRGGQTSDLPPSPLYLKLKQVRASDNELNLKLGSAKLSDFKVRY
jgi:hypothetical protein